MLRGVRVKNASLVGDGLKLIRLYSQNDWF